MISGMCVPLEWTEAAENGVHGVAGQAAERDGTNVGQDLGYLGLAVIPAQVSERCRIEPVEILRVVLSEQDGGCFGRVLGLQRLDLLAEDLVDLFQRHAPRQCPVGVTPPAIAAVGDRGYAQENLLPQRGRDFRPDQRYEKNVA